MLINRDPVGTLEQKDPPMFFGNIGFRFGRKDNYRDLFIAGDADNATGKLAKAMGWDAELKSLQEAYAAANPWDTLVLNQPTDTGSSIVDLPADAAGLSQELFAALTVGGSTMTVDLYNLVRASKAGKWLPSFNSIAPGFDTTELSAAEWTACVATYVWNALQRSNAAVVKLLESHLQALRNPGSAVSKQTATAGGKSGTKQRVGSSTQATLSLPRGASTATIFGGATPPRTPEPVRNSAVGGKAKAKATGAVVLGGKKPSLDVRRTASAASVRSASAKSARSRPPPGNAAAVLAAGKRVVTKNEKKKQQSTKSLTTPAKGKRKAAGGKAAAASTKP